jgi:sulfopyruvate decarboxylase TPP-binding subunit
LRFTVLGHEKAELLRIIQRGGDGMKVAELVIRILEDEGIQAAFGIPGAAINPVYQYLKSSRIRHYIARYEEGAVHAADGYCRASGQMALAICTFGPAATNFVTGLYTAQADSIPLIASWFCFCELHQTRLISAGKPAQSRDLPHSPRIPSICPFEEAPATH